MQKNEQITLTVEEINQNGVGVSHLSNEDGTRGIAVFVQNGVPGDSVKAKVIKVEKNYLVTRVEEILSPSPMRAKKPSCSASGCGGCVYRLIDYGEEKRIKRESVAAAFRRAGIKNAEVLPVLSNDVTDGYRNKAQYPVCASKSGIEAGFFAANTHRLVPASDCKLQPPVFSEIVAFVCGFCEKNGVSAYDEISGKGLLRHVYLRRGTASQEVMVCLVLNGKKLPNERKFADELTANFPSVKSVLLNLNTKKTNVVLGDEYRLLFGKESIEDTLCGLRFSISAGAFFQVNHDTCELLYETAAELANIRNGDTLIDLFCGIGTVGLSMATKAKRIIGIEIVEEAVKRAKENAAKNGVENAEFYCGDASNAEKLLEQAEKSGGKLDGATVILDPPRKGCTEELISYLAKRNFPKILYISCNPETLARDCASFLAKGYNLSPITPVDMFPRTGHVESIAVLER